MSEKTPTMIEFARKVTLEHLREVNPKSSHLLRLVRNIDSLMIDAKILEANGGSNERILFLYLTAFEQLQVLIARFDDLEKLPYDHKEKLAPLNGVVDQAKKILGVDDGDIMTLRSSCLYEDKVFEAKHKLSKYITHLTEFTPQLRSSCEEIFTELDRRWSNSFKAYVDLGCDKEAYERSYQESKKR